MFFFSHSQSMEAIVFPQSFFIATIAKFQCSPSTFVIKFPYKYKKKVLKCYPVGDAPMDRYKKVSRCPFYFLFEYQCLLTYSSSIKWPWKIPSNMRHYTFCFKVLTITIFSLIGKGWKIETSTIYWLVSLFPLHFH